MESSHHEAIQKYIHWREGLTKYIQAGLSRAVPCDMMILALEMEKLSLFTARAAHERKHLDSGAPEQFNN